MIEPNRLVDDPSRQAKVESHRGAPPWRGQGFGLSLCSTYPVHGVDEHSNVDDSPTVSLRLTGSAPRWPAKDMGQRVREIRFPDGTLAMVIEDHGSGGFCIADAHLGAHSISADGSQVHSSPAVGLEPWHWQRLLIGQVLPLVAAINGLEVLHASAVGAFGRAFALAGDSGIGKSTLAALLVLAGHELLTDDVLAVSTDRTGKLLAHPGSTSMSFRASEVSLAERLQRSGIAAAVGRDDKAHVLLSAPAGPLPLRAIYWLRRSAGPVFEAPASPSVIDLMKLTYVRYLRTPERLTRRLKIHAVLARSVALIPVNVPDDLTPDVLTETIEAHMQSLVAG